MVICTQWMFLIFMTRFVFQTRRLNVQKDECLWCVYWCMTPSSSSPTPTVSGTWCLLLLPLFRLYPPPLPFDLRPPWCFPLDEATGRQEVQRQTSPDS